jgi:phosphatidyl-myo-inositol alpha-mannosyltransferase
VRIGLISPYDWSYPGGVRTHIERLTAELRERGHNVIIVTAASGPKSQVTEYGVVKYGWAAPLRFNGSIARIAITPDLRGALRRMISRERFDIIHLHEPFASPLTLAVLRIAKDLGIPCVGTFHASTNKRASTATWAYAMAKPFLRTSFHRLDSYIAVSEAARNHIARFFSADFQIIPNGINLERLDARAQPLPQFMDGKRNILFLSRMEPRKGLRYLLKVIPLVREHSAANGLAPVRFILVGDGPQRARYERFVQRQGWEDVIFTGYVDDDEKLRYFASADIYCAPSTGNESQGVILLEAMAAGAPVVASDIPGYRTVISSPDYGLLTPPRNAERLAWALCHLLRDDELRARLSQNGRQRAAEYNWKRITDEIEQVYNETRYHTIERRWRSRSYYAAGIAQSGLPPAPFDPPTGPIIGIADTSGWAISSFDENVVE